VDSSAGFSVKLAAELAASKLLEWALVGLVVGRLYKPVVSLAQ